MLFFRDQDLAPEPHKALGRRFGELHVHPAANTLEGHENIMIIHADEGSTFVAGDGWHTDVSCDEHPPMASILHLTTVPPEGGDTLVCVDHSSLGCAVAGDAGLPVGQGRGARIGPYL